MADIFPYVLLVAAVVAAAVVVVSTTMSSIRSRRRHGRRDKLGPAEHGPVATVPTRTPYKTSPILRVGRG